MNPWFPLQHDSGSLRSSSRIPLDVSPGALAYNEGQVRSTETVLKERQLTLMSICIGAFFILFLGLFPLGNVTADTEYQLLSSPLGGADADFDGEC